MITLIDNKPYEIIYQQKKIKRTYIRVSANKKIIITSFLKLKDEDIRKLINDNFTWISKQLTKINGFNLHESQFMWFGKIYDIIYNDDISTPYYINNNQLIIKKNGLKELYQDSFQKMANIFINLSNHYQQFHPYLQFRKMKSRWGVCHIKTGKIVLNETLIHVPIENIEYVIYHELTHFISPDHSKNFYAELLKVCPNHKLLKKDLRRYAFLL